MKMNDIGRAAEFLSVRFSQKYSDLAGVESGSIASSPVGDNTGFLTPNGFLWIGDDYGTNLCIRMEDGGVLSIPVDSGIPRRFINASFSRLAESMNEFGRWLLRMESETIRGVGEQGSPGQSDIDQVWSSLEEIDSSALEGEENWWSVIIEQLRDGMI
jgi:hypothetical protein